MNWIVGGSLNGGSHRQAGAGNATRTGARAGRIVRLVRMVRLIRMVKLYKYVQTAFEKNKNAKIIAHTVAEEDDGNFVPGMESRVGAAMSDSINRK